MSESKNPLALLGDFASNLDEKLNTVAAETGIGKPKDLTLPDNPVTIAPRVKPPADWAEKQIKNAKAASGNWLKGVLNPRKNPVEAAIKADGKRKNKLEEAERQGKWLKSMQKVNIDEMYKTIEAGGSGQFEQGIAKREGKIKGAVEELQPMVTALAEELDKLPVDTPEQREAKMIAAKRGMEAIGKKRRGIS